MSRYQLKSRDARTCGNCDAQVYWTEPYCSQCRDLPVRRCLDCGRSGPNGRFEYSDVATAQWEPMANPPAISPDRVAFEPLAIEPLKDSWKKVAVPGPCSHCESTRLAPLDFGIDRMPEAERWCKAWPKSPRYGKSVSFRGIFDDPGISYKTCGRCEDTFTGKDKVRRQGIRVDLPDGKYKFDDRPVHVECWYVSRHEGRAAA
jgi:hypothetical protein